MTINSTTDDLIAEIEAAAKAATPGPCHIYTNPRDDSNWQQNAIFHAKCQPQDFLALVARLRELEKDAARYRFIASSKSRADVEPCIAEVTWSESGEAEFEILCNARADTCIDFAMKASP